MFYKINIYILMSINLISEFKFSGKTEQGRMSHTENGNIGKNVLKLSDNIKKLYVK